MRLLVLAGFLTSLACFGQPVSKPEIGKRFPDVTFTGVDGYVSKEFAVSGQRGKWLFIDFWSLGCKACLTGFAVYKDIQEEFGDRVQFFLVGKKDRDFNKNIESIYRRVSKNMSLRFPHVYDTLLRAQWEVDAYPWIFVIDPDGILRYITDGRDLSVEKVSKLLAGQEVSLFPLLRAIEPPTSATHVMTDAHPLYASVLQESGGEGQYTAPDFVDLKYQPVERLDNGWRVNVVPLYALYNYAYLGQWRWGVNDKDNYGAVAAYPILELNDTSRFVFDYRVWPAVGTYDCYLRLPTEASPEAFMAELQHALLRTFGYRVTMETRAFPVWYLVAGPGAQRELRSKGREPYITSSSAAGGFDVRNMGMDRVITMLTSYLRQDRRAVFLDATGIDTPVDFSIVGDMTDFAVVQEGLKKYHLSFVRGTKEMKTLVIHEP